MAFNKLSSFTTALWNQKSDLFSAENIDACLQITSKITTIAICILPKDALPSNILPVITIIDSIKDVLPACIKALSKDQSIKTMLKCSGLMTLALAPSAIQFSSILTRKSSNNFQSITYRDFVCKEGSDADIVFNELKSCVLDGHTLSVCSISSNSYFSKSIRLTEQYRDGIQSVLQFENREPSFIRFNRNHFTATVYDYDGKLTSQQIDYKDSAKSIDRSFTQLEMEVWLTVDKTARFVGCRFKTMIPRSISFSDFPYCFSVYSTKESYVTCIGSKPSEFTLKDAFVQFKINTEKLHSNKIYSLLEEFPCSKGLVPKRLCKSIQEPYI